MDPLEGLDDMGWRNLELLENKVVQLDYRQGIDKQKIPGFLKLYELGLATLKETGPGDSIHVFRISEAGKAALAARRDG